MDIIVEMRFRAHLYGTETATADLDLKAVYLPSARDILLQRAAAAAPSGDRKQHGARNAPGDVDREVYSLQRYVQLLAEGQTVALDMLFAPDDTGRPKQAGRRDGTRRPPWDRLAQAKKAVGSAGDDGRRGVVARGIAGRAVDQQVAEAPRIDRLLEHRDVCIGAVDRVGPIAGYEDERNAERREPVGDRIGQLSTQIEIQDRAIEGGIPQRRLRTV